MGGWSGEGVSCKSHDMELRLTIVIDRVYHLSTLCLVEWARWEDYKG